MTGPSIDTPVVLYSPLRYWIAILVCVLFGLSMLVYGSSEHRGLMIATGAACLLFAGLFWLGVRTKLSGGGPALARDGEFLFGGELRRPLPVAATTFEIQPDNEGSWIVVLRSGDATIRLAAGGWRIEGERFFTKAVAERVLLDLGLAPQTRP